MGGAVGNLRSATRALGLILALGAGGCTFDSAGLAPSTDGAAVLDLVGWEHPPELATVPCGKLKQTCCTSGATCEPGLQCDGVLCQSCGATGESCCGNSLPCTSPQEVCGPGSICGACGGSLGPCCGTAPICGPGLVCSTTAPTDPGTCAACRGTDQPCCTSGPDCAASHVCTAGICKAVTCGAPNQPCCTGKAQCPPGLTCDGTKTCTLPPACGAEGQVCCGANCQLGLVCKGTSCVRCGELLQPCCPGNACNSWGVVCNQTTHLCVVCGTSNNPCCTFGVFGTCLNWKACQNNVCGAIGCGQAGQDCCAGDKCYGWHITCQGKICKSQNR